MKFSMAFVLVGDTTQVRAVQRRLGMLACTSDLSEEFKEELHGVRKALEQQTECNSVVDRVVSNEVCSRVKLLCRVTSTYRHGLLN